MAVSVKEDDAILKEARERYSDGIDFDRDNREEDLNDRKFQAGEQYPPEVLAERRGRPCEVYNRLNQLVRQVTGEMRQNKPEIRVLPTDDQSDKELAKVYSAIIRHIENASDAHRVYVTAGESAVRGGIGYFRILTDFVDENSFDQDILIKPIRNPASVVTDPDAQEQTGSDASWRFVTEMVSLKKFKAAHPKVATDDFERTGTSGDLQSWQQGEFIRVAEYWVRKRDGEKLLAYCSDGSTREVPDGSQEGGIVERANEEPLQIVALRKVPRYKVCWYRMTGTAIIDRGDWAGSIIPIVTVVGEEVSVGERTVRKGLIRDAKGSQRTHNYAINAIVEHVALQPKAPYMATAKQILPYKAMWDNANTNNTPYLLFEPDPMAPGRPERQQPPTMPSAIYQLAELADQSMKATTGIYDASLGQRSNETSGKAILARQQEGDTGTYLYIDNLTAAITTAGKILIELIPKIYTSERVIRMVGEDGKVEGFARVNSISPDGKPLNDLSQGKYDVVVTTGPAYASRRQQAADSMMQFAQAAPNAMPLMADLIPDSMDWPNADKIATRLRKALPPGIDADVDAERAKEAEANPEQAQKQAQMTQMQEEAAMIELRLKDFQAQKAEAEATLAEINVEVRKVELMKMATGGDQSQPVPVEDDGGAEYEMAQMKSATEVEIARIRADADVIIAQINAQQQPEGERDTAPEIEGLESRIEALTAMFAQMAQPKRKRVVTDELGNIVAIEEEQA